MLGPVDGIQVVVLGAPEVLGVMVMVLASETGFLPKTRFLKSMRRSDAVELAAMARAVTYEQARGWDVEHVSRSEGS